MGKKAEAVLGKEAQQLEQAGADFLLICTNTMHKVAPQIAEYLTIPILHIADATIAELQAQQSQKGRLIRDEIYDDSSFLQTENYRQRDRCMDSQRSHD